MSAQKLTVECWVAAFASEYSDTGYFWVTQGYEPTKAIFCKRQDVEFDVPADFNPIAATVANLEEQKKQALADYQATVAKLNERLSKLLAITNGVEA